MSCVCLFHDSPSCKKSFVYTLTRLHILYINKKNRGQTHISLPGKTLFWCLMHTSRGYIRCKVTQCHEYRSCSYRSYLLPIPYTNLALLLSRIFSLEFLPFFHPHSSQKLKASWNSGSLVFRVLQAYAGFVREKKSTY